MASLSSILSRRRLFSAWATLVTAKPWLTLLVSVAAAAAALAITAARLEFHPDRSELVDPSLPWQQRYASYKRNFPRWGDAVVVIDSASAPQATIDAFIDELVRRVRSDEHFGAASSGYDASEMPPGLLLAEPTQRVREVVDQLRQTAPILAASSPADLLRLSLVAGELNQERRTGLATLLKRLGDAGNDDSQLASASGRTRLTTRDGSLHLVLVALEQNKNSGGLNRESEGVETLRELLRDLHAQQQFAALDIGLTGVSVLETDEAAQSITDATRSSILAMLLISILMMWVYRGAVVPLLAMASLLIGVAWSFGWLTLAVGHLQLLSIVFAVILLGLGVDTAVHFIARLELVHPDHTHMRAAVNQTFRGVGAGVITASLTTAAAFTATALTEFRGIAEMGLIAAGGVVLCTISVLSCFPALLEIIPHPERRLRTHRGGENRQFMGGLFNIVDRRPLLFVTGWVVLLTLFGWLASGVRYDPDLLKLLPPRAPSVVWAKRLERADNRSMWSAVVTASPEHASDLAHALRKLPLVAGVQDAGALYPEELDAKRAQLARLPNASAMPRSEHPGDFRPVASALAKRWEGRDEAIALAAAVLANLSDSAVAAANSDYQAQRAALGARIESLRHAEPASPDELPQTLRAQWVGADGSLLLRIHPTAASEAEGGSALSRERLAAFATQVLAIAPSATGSAIQIYESTKLIGRAYLLAAVYALIAILVILLIDFRNVADALCALIPVAAGTALLLGVMRLADMSLNFANTIIMPLMIGLGVDAGVHAIHRWRQQPNDMPAGLAGGSGRAITLSTATTAIGFACMLISQHRGIRSLGFVMSVGLVMVWLAAVLLLPGVLRLRSQLHQRAGTHMPHRKTKQETPRHRVERRDAASV